MSALYFIAGLIILYKVGLFKRKTNAEVSDKSLKVGNEIRNTTLLLVVCLSLGAGVLQFLEGLSSSEMLRMFLGQRDILFKSDRGKMFAIVWIFVGLSVLSKLVRHLMEYGCIKMAKCFRA